jgi:hypothetical protein
VGLGASRMEFVARETEKYFLQTVFAYVGPVILRAVVM